MSEFDEDKRKHAEPYRTKRRSDFPSTTDARKWLDAGGHLEADEEALYRHMAESRRRLMVLLPTALWVGIDHGQRNHLFAISPEVLIGLERGAGAATRWLHRDTLEATLQTITQDAQRLLKTIGGDDVAQCILGCCYMILALVDRDQMPDPTAQCVLSAIGIVEEARNDAHEGRSGAWGYNEHKVDEMVNKGIDRLMMSGYL